MASDSGPELPATTPITIGIHHPDKPLVFRTLLVIYQLITTIRLGFPGWKVTGDSRPPDRFTTKSYGYVDALITLGLRRDEIIAAVEIAPGSGVMVSESSEGKPTDEKPQVCCQFLLVAFCSNYPTFQRDPDSSVDSDFYDTGSHFSPASHVAGITNPHRGCKLGTRCDQIKLLDSGKSLWEEVKKDPTCYLRMVQDME
jgi:hypothetical protein